jgi:hypothetical protein
MAETHRPSFEPAEITRLWFIGGAIGGFLLFVVVLMGILLLAYLGVAPKPQPPKNFPEPRLQPHPHADLQQFLQAQQKKLERTGWIDKSSGIAAIPVEKAMKIIAGRGASAFDPLPEAAGGQSGGTP